MSQSTKSSKSSSLSGHAGAVTGLASEAGNAPPRVRLESVPALGGLLWPTGIAVPRGRLAALPPRGGSVRGPFSAASGWRAMGADAAPCAAFAEGAQVPCGILPLCPHVRQAALRASR